MAKVVTRSHLLSRLAVKAGIEKKAAAVVLEELEALGTKDPKGSRGIIIRGPRKAVKAERKRRVERNPQTGQPIVIPKKTVVKFRPVETDEVFATLAKVFRKL